MKLWCLSALQQIQWQLAKILHRPSWVMAPHGAKSYATALLDTLDLLSERSIAAPLGATAAKSSISLARRITLLKNRTPEMRPTIGRLVLLVAVAAVPMAIAFAVEPPAVQRRAINRVVKDFPEKTDLSTPEAAQAAWNRAAGRMDAKAVSELGARTFGPRDIEELEQFWKRDPKDTAVYNEAQLNAEILEVATYREDFANVITKLNFPESVGRDPYSSRSFGRISGVWKNLGEDWLPSLEAARENFDRKKDVLWQTYVKVRDSIKKGQPVLARGESTDRSAQIAPGEPLGISVEKADLMGRIEWAMMHGGRDITTRKSIEWGDVQKDEKGNRTIRYKYYATIWDKDIYVMNQVFTFDAKGNILNMENAEGFPQKKVEKPANVSTQQAMKELVEDFFNKNLRDITSRETIEWGEVTKAGTGNSSIRYKYRAKIWDKYTKIMNQVFTFDPKGKFVSEKDVVGFPQNQ